MRTIAILALMLLSLTAAFAQTESEKTRITAEIRHVLDDQSTAWNSGDIDGFMAGYWRSPELVFVSGDSITRGWQPTLDRYKKGYDSREKMGTLTFSDLEYKILSNDAAVVLGSWALKRAGDTPHGKLTLTFRRFKEGWRIILDHTS